MKKELINCDSYLFTINECCRLFRLNRDSFMQEFVLSGKLPFVVVRGQKKFMHADLKALLNNSLQKYDIPGKGIYGK